MSTVFANLTMTSKVYHAPLTEAGKALPPGEYVLLAVPAAEQARFAQTYCSQCGREQGPGDSGVSRCADHVTGTQPAHILPAFLGVAKRKLDDLLAQGYRINGFEIERESPDGTVVERGAITVGGMVLWWHPEKP